MNELIGIFDSLGKSSFRFLAFWVNGFDRRNRFCNRSTRLWNGLSTSSPIPFDLSVDNTVDAKSHNHSNEYHNHHRRDSNKNPIDECIVRFGRWRHWWHHWWYDRRFIWDKVSSRGWCYVRWWVWRNRCLWHSLTILWAVDQNLWFICFALKSNCFKWMSDQLISNTNLRISAINDTLFDSCEPKPM